MTARTGRFVCAAYGAFVVAAVLLVAASPAAAQQRALRDGIKVHGHWTIDVKNADGTLASHHEFENALQLGGQAALANLLGRQATIVGWSVEVDDGSPENFGFLIQDQGAAAYLPFSGPGTSTNLVITIGPNAQAVLQGSVTAAFGVQLARVDTTLVTLSSPTATRADQWTFTQHTLTQPISVQANQIVQVTVVFSFS